MTRLHYVGRIALNLERPCRRCWRPLPLSAIADGYSTHPSCDLPSRADN